MLQLPHEAGSVYFLVERLQLPCNLIFKGGMKHAACWAMKYSPNDAEFARLRRTRTDVHPLQVCPVRGVDPLNLQVRGVFTL